MLKYKRGIFFYVLKLPTIDVIALEGLMNQLKDPIQMNVESRIPPKFKNFKSKPIKRYIDNCINHCRKYVTKRETTENSRKPGDCILCKGKFLNYPSWSTHFARKHPKEFEKIKDEGLTRRIYIF